MKTLLLWLLIFACGFGAAVASGDLSLGRFITMGILIHLQANLIVLASRD